METSQNSNGETLFDLTSFAAATHASLLASRGIDEEKKTIGISGPLSVKPLATYDRDTQSWRMYADTFLSDSTEFSGTFPSSGIASSGTLYARPPLEPLIVESGSLLWPTPTTHGEIIGTRVESQRRRMEAGLKYSSRLPQAIALRYPEDHGYLSPMWVELLMGFPPGWTDLEV
jgi:hypothetical protein